MSVTAFSTSPEIGGSGATLALLPIGSVEQHAAHLPVGTDLFIAREVARRVAERLDCLLLPAIPFSVSIEHMGLPGTVAIRNETLTRYVRDILESLGKHGIARVCLLNSHGGNFVLKPFVRELNLRGGFPRTILAETWLGHAERDPADALGDKHAGHWETSIMLAVAKASVHADRAADAAPDPGGFDMCDYVGWERVTPTGVWGWPTRASAERGVAFLDEAVDFLVAHIPRTFAEVDRLLAPGAPGAHHQISEESM